MTTPHPGQTELVPAGVRRLGYALAIAFSVGILFVVNNLPEGEQIPFLTNDFEQLLPIINALPLREHRRQRLYGSSTTLRGFVRPAGSR